MIKINKSKLPPEMVIRKEEDYRSKEVLTILQQDFHNKCYICEEKYPTSINVEHIRSVKNYEHLKYKWENLFYACFHCNKIKGSSYDHIIDCTKKDPEIYILMCFNAYPTYYVEVVDRINSTENEKTKELLDKIYNGTGTSISKIEADNLKNKISNELRQFLEYTESYFNESDFKLKAVYLERIKRMLSRESNFAGFKRSMVIQDKELSQHFRELLNDK
ncbi:HNH endonuclease [Lachnospiraceae bacterium 38-10]